jgi:hypothetical protein
VRVAERLSQLEIGLGAHMELDPTGSSSKVKVGQARYMSRKTGQMSLRIGLDLDGVVADWVSSAIKVLKDRGSIIPEQAPPYWDWLKEHARPEDWKFLWGPAMKFSYQFAEPYKGSVEFANRLKNFGDVIIMTSRPKGSWTATIQWWWDHMGYTPAGFNFFDSGLDKYRVHTDVFIEDNLNYANDYAHKWLMGYDNPEVFLLDRPWNQGYTEYLNVTRMPDYESIIKEIERIKNESTD